MNELIVTKYQKASSAWSACNCCVQAIQKHDESDDLLPEIQSFGRLMLPHARACYELESLLDEKSRSTIKWQTLGNLCMTQGASDTAIGCFTLALQYSVAMNNIERTQTTLSLASLYQEQNNLKECRKLLNKIDIIGVKTEAPDLEFRVQLVTAAELAAEGDLEDAKEAYNKLEKDQETCVGPIDYNTVLAVHKLAITLKALGRLEESQALYRRAFTSYKMLLGQNDPITLEVAEELAQILQLRGAFSEAEAMYKLCIKVKTVTLGPDHPSTATSIARLATLLDLKCNFEEADQNYQEALRIMRISLGESHPLTVTTVEDRALSYRMRSWYTEGDQQKGKALKESEDLYEKVIKLKKESSHRYSKEQIESSEAKLAEMRKGEELLKHEDVKLDVNRLQNL
jgi:tetratricopeptide (TPR) repeat protein